MSTRSELQQSGAAFIQQKLTRLLERCSAEGIDIIGIGEAFLQRGWNTSDWPQQLRHLPVDLDARVRILDGQALKD
ncbi:hypothetical protein B5M42_017680 [Paenibacillus athensensis]|nr:Ger(x)C family spore germination C-terminal domain-containing protein [Paenibacillus athensensis]MCD1260635.1 hypothetical protein [Paenibacillus athensensis]